MKKIIAALGLLGVMVSTSSVSGMDQYEIENGLTGMRRDVVLKLINKMRFADPNIKNIIGMSEEHLLWKNHFSFAPHQLSELSRLRHLETACRDIRRGHTNAQIYQRSFELLRSILRESNPVGIRYKPDLWAAFEKLHDNSDTDPVSSVHDFLFGVKDRASSVYYRTHSRWLLIRIETTIECGHFGTSLDRASLDRAYIVALIHACGHYSFLHGKCFQAAACTLEPILLYEACWNSPFPEDIVNLFLPSRIQRLSPDLIAGTTNDKFAARLLAMPDLLSPAQLRAVKWRNQLTTKNESNEQTQMKEQ